MQRHGRAQGLIRAGGGLLAALLLLLIFAPGCQVIGGAVALALLGARGGGGGGGGAALPAAPTVTSVTPGRGPQQGGTEVTLAGASFTAGALQVFVGGVQVQSLTIVSDTEARGRTSAVASPGLADVVVSNGGGSATLPAAFEFLAPPLVTRVQPSDGPIAGGTVIEVIGSDFVDGTVVRIGGALLVGQQTAGGTLISGTLPAFTLPEGQTFAFVDVEVENERGVGVLPQGFAYFGAPLVTSVEPVEGPYAPFELRTPGGTTLRPPELRVRGIGFLSGTMLAFAHGLGGGIADPIPLDGQEIVTRSVMRAEARFPLGLDPQQVPSISTTVDLVATNPLTGSRVAEGAFTLRPPPRPTATAPRFAAPGLAVRVLGSSFPADLRAFAGTFADPAAGTPAPQGLIGDVQGVEATVESVAAGEVTVRIPPTFDPDAIPLLGRDGRPANPATATEVLEREGAPAISFFSPTAGIARAAVEIDVKWREHGPVRGGVYEVAVGAAGEVHAATESGLHVTGDGGASWSRLDGAGGAGPLANLNVTALAIAPGGRIWVGTSFGPATVEAGRPAGVFRSDDGGATWIDANGNLPLTASGARASVNDLAADLADPDVLIAAFVAPDAVAAGMGDGPFAPAAAGAIWKTTDGGVTWTAASALAPPPGPAPAPAPGPAPAPAPATLDEAERVVFSPGSSTRLYALCSLEGGVFRSEDAGATWSLLIDDQGGRVYAIAIDPGNPQRIAVATDESLLLSENGGAGFQARGLTLMSPPGDPAPDAMFAAYDLAFEGSGALLLASNAGLVRTTDGGATYRPLEAAVPVDDRVPAGVSMRALPEPPVLRTALPSVVAGATGIFAAREAPRTQILASLDGGDTFEAIGATLGSGGVLALAPQVVGTETGGAFLRVSGRAPTIFGDLRPRGTFLKNEFLDRPGGGNRPRAPVPLHAGEVEVASVAAGPSTQPGGTPAELTLYYGLGGGGGVLVFEPEITPGERNPRRASVGLPGPPVPRVRALVAARTTLSVYAAIEGAGVFASADRGRTWSATAALPDGPVDLGLSGSATFALYAVTAGGRLFRNDDPAGAASWVELTAIGAATVTAVEAGIDGRVYAATPDRGVLASGDRGATFAPGTGLSGGALEVRALAPHPRDPAVVFAGTADGVHVSTDGGASFAPFNLGLPVRDIRVLGFSQDRTDIVELAASGPDGRLFVLRLGRGD